MRKSLVVLAIGITACAGTSASTTTTAVTPSSSTTSRPPIVSTTTATVPEQVAEFLDEVYTIMYENAVEREVIDWVQFRSMWDAATVSVAPSSISEAHSVIRRSLSWLRDSHSTFFAPEEVAEWTEPPARTVKFEPSLLEGEIGYVLVPWFSTSSEEAINGYATELQQTIANLAAQGACGWIVDLRTNLGGSMWPMVAGLGPLLGNGVFGENVRPDGNNIPWLYENGEAWWGGDLLARTLDTPFEFRSDLPPTAVLIGARTASAGEAVALAFKGRADAQSFGQATAGLTSAPEPYQLSDGSILFLADSYMGDRHGNPYPNGVDPDVAVDSGDLLETALEWLQSHSACS